MSEIDPGLDRHIWEAELEGMEDGLRTAPAESLPDFLDLVERMLAAHGYDTTPHTTDAAPDVAAGLARARELVERLARGDDVATDDAFQSAAELRALYRGLVDEPAGDAGGATDGA
jgi:hypothetical protein